MAETGAENIVVVPDRRVLLVPRRLARKIRWPQHLKSRTVHWRRESWLALPHDLETAWKLAADGIDAPGPIMYYYNWPARFQPYDHQRRTADFLTKYRRAYVANDMGTGKTMSALWAADFLRRAGEVDKVLIVSPLSTLERVWGDSIYNATLGEYGILYGTKAKRLQVMERSYDYYIINPDGLTVFLETQGRRASLAQPFREFLAGIDLVVVDEAAVFRNSRTDRWKALNLVCKDDRKRVWLMSGSPMPNAPTDIWAQARLLSEELVPRYFTRFRDTVMTKVSTFTWRPKPGWENTVWAMVQPSIRIKLEDCIDLPEMIEEIRHCELSPEQKRVAEELKREYRAELKGGSLTAANEGARRVKLLQVYGGVVYGDDGTTKLLPCGNRLSALTEAIDEAGEKAIVFAAFRHQIDLLVPYLRLKYKSVEAVHGGVGVSARNVLFRRFQEGDLKVLVAHPGTMAHGLTLTAASTVIWYCPIDDFELYEQANRRIRRPGQTRRQVVVHIEGSPLERSMYRRLHEKRSMQGLLLELLESE